MVAATIANRKDANSQGVTPAPDKSLQENDPQQLTTGPSAFNPRDIRKQIQAGVQAPAAIPSDAAQLEQSSSPTRTQTDPRADHVLKMQESFKQQALDNAPPDQRERLADSLKTSQELVSLHKAVNEQIQTLGQNADPNTLKQLQTHSELLIKQSAATLLQANTEHTINGIEQRQKELSEKIDKLQEDVKQLEKLEGQDPQRLAGTLEVKKEQLKSLQATGQLLDTMRSSLASSFETSNSFLQRASDLRQEQPKSAAQLTEATANIDSALLVLQDADEKTSLHAIDVGLQHLEEAHRQELERREAFAQNITEFDAQEKRLRDATRDSIGRAQSAINDGISSTADINEVRTSWTNPYLPFASWVTGTTAALESSRDNLLETAGEQNKASNALIERRQAVRKAKEEYIKLTISGFEAERRGDVDRAQTLFNHAQLLSSTTSTLADPQAIHQVLTQPSRSWQQRNLEVAKKLDDAIASANNWETGLEVTRNVVVVAGATVATIATAGAGAGIFAAFAYGAGGGIAVGSLSNVAEQVTATASGLKTKEQALSDFGRRFQKDAITSLEAAGTTATGLGVGRAFQSTTLVSKLSTPVARTASGAVGGVSSGASTTAIDTARTLYMRNEAIAEFNSSPAAQGLSPEQRQVALEEYLRSEKLSLDDLVKRGVVNIGIGAVGGSIGANTGALRDTAKTALGKISTVILDTTIDAALGFSATLITDGSISFEQGLAQSLQSVFVGNALSSLPARRPIAPRAPSESPSAKFNYHEDPTTLREQFISDSITKLTAEKQRPPTTEETATIEAEAKRVRAYENPQTGEIHVVKINTDSMSRAERVRYASDIVHELAHRRGGGEVIAHKAQFEYLVKNGYQPEIVDGQLKIRTLGDGETGILPSDEQIKDYVARNYDAEESVAGMRLSKGEDAEQDLRAFEDSIFTDALAANRYSASELAGESRLAAAEGNEANGETAQPHESLSDRNLKFLLSTPTTVDPWHVAAARDYQESSTAINNALRSGEESGPVSDLDMMAEQPIRDQVYRVIENAKYLGTDLQAGAIYQDAAFQSTHIELRAAENRLERAFNAEPAGTIPVLIEFDLRHGEEVTGFFMNQYTISDEHRYNCENEIVLARGENRPELVIDSVVLIHTSDEPDYYRVRPGKEDSASWPHDWDNNPLDYFEREGHSYYRIVVKPRH